MVVLDQDDILDGVTNKQFSATEQTANKGVANGYASLDGGGKIPAAQLPSSVMEYKGTWDASTNSPLLTDGVGDNGDVYRVSVAGTQNLGSGNITFAAGDWIIYNGTIWEKSINSDAVDSVAGKTGVGTLHAADIISGTFADARISPSSVTQHQAALSITESQISDYNPTVDQVVTDTSGLPDSTWYITCG